MIEWLVGFTVLFFLGVIFYKQSVQEFRLNQIEWDQRHQIDALYDERVPVVVRSMPQPPVWTQEDVMIRDFYGSERPLGEKRSLRDIIMSTDGLGTNWPPAYRQHLWDVTGLALWFDKFWAPVIAGQRGWLAGFLPAAGECFYGPRGLEKVTANWQLIVPTEGAIVVSIMTSKYGRYLPAKWRGLYVSKMTKKTVPFVDELKYVDIIVRPGTALWIPSHWFACWEAKDEGMVPLVAVVNIHTPISYLVSRGR